MAEEIKKVKTFKEIEDEAAEELNVFVFIVFVPNPMRHSVRLWIDGGEHETYMDLDRFLNIISTTCGPQEMNRISVACMEYGSPFIYDRHKKMLKQLNELPQPDEMKLSSDYHKQYEGNSKDPYSTDNYFNAAQKATKGLREFGLPNFEPTNARQTKN